MSGSARLREPAMSEAQLQQAVIEAAQALGFRCAHFRPAMTQSGRWVTPMQGDVGFPDCVIAGHGRLWFVEFKSATGRASEHQDAWLEELTRAGAEAIVLWPSGLDWFINHLKEAK